MRKLVLPRPPQAQTVEELARYINALHQELLRFNFELNEEETSE